MGQHSPLVRLVSSTRRTREAHEAGAASGGVQVGGLGVRGAGPGLGALPSHAGLRWPAPREAGTGGATRATVGGPSLGGQFGRGGGGGAAHLLGARGPGPRLEQPLAPEVPARAPCPRASARAPAGGARRPPAPSEPPPPPYRATPQVLTGQFGRGGGRGGTRNRPRESRGGGGWGAVVVGAWW